MKSLWHAIALAGLLAGSQAVAQEAADGSGAGINLGETVIDGRAVGEEYIKEEFGDWSHRCVVAADGDDPCSSYQLLADENGNSVAEITIVPIAGAERAVAGGTIVTPLETLLTAQVTLQVDSGPGRRYPFSFCTRAGCISRVGFTQDDIDAMKRGNVARLTIVPAGAPDQQVVLQISLTGFTAAFDGL